MVVNHGVSEGIVMMSFEDFEETKRGMWVPRCLEIVVQGCENSFVVFA